MIFSIHTFELTKIFKSKGRYKRMKDFTPLVKGIEVKEHDNGEERVIKLKVNPTVLLDGDDLDLWKPSEKNIDKLINKLDKRIEEYLDCELNDFTLTRCDFTVNLAVGSSKRVTTYIKLLHNSGKVTGFSQKFDSKDYDNGIDKDTSFDLVHADGVEFTAYDKWEQSKHRRGEGILRIEVRLKKQKVICNYTKKTDTSDQLTELASQCEGIFMNTFRRIIPLGNHYTMKEAVTLVERNVSKKKQREKMLKVLELTRKDTLHIALKQMDKNAYRIMLNSRKLMYPLLLSGNDMNSNILTVYILI